MCSLAPFMLSWNSLLHVQTMTPFSLIKWQEQWALGSTSRLTWARTCVGLRVHESEVGQCVREQEDTHTPVVLLFGGFFFSFLFLHFFYGLWSNQPLTHTQPAGVQYRFTATAVIHTNELFSHFVPQMPVWSCFTGSHFMHAERSEPSESCFNERARNRKWFTDVSRSHYTLWWGRGLLFLYPNAWPCHVTFSKKKKKNFSLFFVHSSCLLCISHPD